MARQTRHDWPPAYAASSLAGLADRSPKAQSCPHQMAPAAEARVSSSCAERIRGGAAQHRPSPRQRRVETLPGRSSIYRCWVRHGLIAPESRRRRRSDYKHWERSKAMEPWQMDSVAGASLADGSEAMIITGFDDTQILRVCAPGGPGHMPKGTDLSVQTAEYLARFARSLNARARPTDS